MVGRGSRSPVISTGESESDLARLSGKWIGCHHPSSAHMPTHYPRVWAVAMALMLSLSLATAVTASAGPSGLLIDFQKSPGQGIRLTTPQFSWIVANHPTEANAVQGAYRIRVWMLDGINTSVWDSGKVWPFITSMFTISSSVFICVPWQSCNSLRAQTALTAALQRNILAPYFVSARQMMYEAWLIDLQ